MKEKKRLKKHFRTHMNNSESEETNVHFKAPPS